MQLFKNLLTNSYDGDYYPVISVIKDYLEKHTSAKIIIQKYDEKKANLLAIWGKPTLVINAHMDTVVPAEAWSRPPTELYEKDGKIYGLGTCDTKGNIYAILTAIEKTEPKNLMLLFSFDEETGGIESGVTFFLESPYSKYIKNAIVRAHRHERSQQTSRILFIYHNQRERV